MTDTIDALDIENVVGYWDEQEAHLTCCARDEFLCGRPYHPELRTFEDEPHERCDDCTDLLEDGWCPSITDPTHFHCPLVESRSGIIAFCAGPEP